MDAAQASPVSARMAVSREQNDHPLVPRGVRAARAQARSLRLGWHHGGQMSKSPSRRFPVTVTQLPVTRCEICHRTVAYRPGRLSEVLTEHYRRAHPEVLGAPSQ
jgi:hypothetical protein